MVSREEKHSAFIQLRARGKEKLKTLREVQQFAQTIQLNDRFPTNLCFSFVNESFISGFV